MNAERVHTLADLDEWQFDGTPLAVLGHPVEHSLSPPMHNAALADLALSRPEFARWRYFKFDIDPSLLAEALPRFHRCGFAGLNLTIPHKVIAMELVKELDPAAAETGAVNTLRPIAGGFEGFNTDGYGVSEAIKEDLGATLAGSPVILLGAGGAARAAAVTCMREGCSELWIGNRTRGKLAHLLRGLAPVTAQTGISLNVFDLTRPPGDLPADALVINATSAGLKADDAPPIELSALRGKPRIYDMIYNPPDTLLLRNSAARGLKASNGLSMLVHQGARALEIWTGASINTSIMHSACRTALGWST